MSDIFSYSGSGVALVNPVNCVGIMGKGLALSFKEKYPSYFREYKFLCDSHIVRPGMTIIHRPKPPTQPSYIVSFPTKDHWKYQSKLSWIEDGLIHLASLLPEYNDSIFTIVVPPLGCGLGGLDYRDVRPLIVRYLYPLDQALVLTGG